jgi:hypothetical protein
MDPEFRQMKLDKNLVAELLQITKNFRRHIDLRYQRGQRCDRCISRRADVSHFGRR